MSNLELANRAAGATVCNILDVAAPNLIGAGIWALPSGLGTKVGLGFMGLGTAAYMASEYLCPEVVVSGTTPVPGVDGCQKVGGYGQLEYNDGTGWKAAGSGGSETITAVTVSIDATALTGPNNVGFFFAEATITTTSFGQVKINEGDGSEAMASAITWRINPTVGSCEEVGGQNPLPPDVYNPTPYTDPVTNCNYNVTFQGFIEQTPGGPVSPVLLIEGTSSVRAGGGVIGGCNFPPIVFVPDGNGGGPIVPAPPGPPPPPGPPNPDDPPWWLDGVVGGLIGAATTILYDSLLDALTPPLPESSFTLTAPCQVDDEGKALEREWKFPTQRSNDRLIDHQVALFEVLQQHLNWKTPTCSGGSQPVTGDAVSINWVSDEYSPVGNDRIRKLLTYFDQNNTSFEDTVTHWKDFSWNAGPVIVSCVGTPLGRPQVWAESVDEAKRVINHAASIAGVDLTKAEWQVAPPKSSRYGMSGVMRVAKGRSGQLSITKRDGPSGLPEVLTPIPTPGSG
jgi:hypothetical protein